MSNSAGRSFSRCSLFGVASQRSFSLRFASIERLDEQASVTYTSYAAILYRNSERIRYYYQEVKMKISARNCLEGKIVAIHEGPVSTEVTIETAAGERIVSSITTTSAKALNLKVGDKAYAVIKASNVMVAVD